MPVPLAAIAANVASGPTPLLKFLFEDNTTNGGSYGGSVTTNGTAAYVTGNGGGKAGDFGTGSKFQSLQIAGSNTVLANMAQLTVQFDYKGSTAATETAVEIYGGYEIDFNSSGTTSVYIGTDNNAFANLPAFSTSLKDGNWHTVKMTYKTGELKLFVDGSQVGSTVTTVTGDVLAVSYDLYIGKSTFGGGQLTGNIDNFYIYDTVV